MAYISKNNTINPMIGALSMILAALLFSCLSGLVRLAADIGYHPFQIGFLRSIFALLFMIPFIAPILHREGIGCFKMRHPALYLARGLATTGSTLLSMVALATLPIVEVTAISFTAPLFATACSALLLKEIVGWRRWSAVMLGLCGVLIILRPGFVMLEVGALAALGAAISMALASILVKMLTRTETIQHIVFYTSLILTLATAIPASVVWVQMTPLMWLVGAGMGVLGALSHVFMAKAFRVADASLVIPFDYARLPFAALVGWFLFGQTSDITTWIGALVIAVPALFVARREQVIARRTATGLH